MFIFKKRTVFNYEYKHEAYLDLFTPSKKNIPDWYKKIPKWKNNKMFNAEDGILPTVKNCMPFLDSFTVGYTINLPYDIYIKNENNALYVYTNPEIPDIPKLREQPSDPKMIPLNHYPYECIWSLGVSIKIPTGYSVLFTHPLNRYDLPFTTLSGIIDGGMTINSDGNIPFYIKENFEGIIEKGTPVAQIIPFRQENWKRKKVIGIEKQAKINNFRSLSVFSGWYKKTFWINKKYE
jgi:hypothetical protein